MSYKELVGNKCRGNIIGPVVFPDTCPDCGAATKEITGPNKWPEISYMCGGGYKSKPQIQNHTDYWYGRCGSMPR